MKTLVTGSSGFVGGHLVAALKASSDITEICDPGDLDLTQKEEVRNFIKEHKPEAVFHLAAQSNVPDSFKNPEATFNVNLFGTLHLLQALDEFCPQCTVIIVSTGEVYGKSFKEFDLVDEKTPLAPMNPYASSKAAADLFAGQFALSSQLKIIRARPLNHFGPGQSNKFVIPSFAEQLLKVKYENAKPQISVGDLSPKRDFLDVQDVISAYLLLLTKRDEIPTGSVFNICSSQPTKIRDILDQLIAAVDTNVEVVVDEKRLRPTEIPTVNASNLKIKTLGWEQKYSLDESLKKLVNHLSRALNYVD